MDNGFKSHKLCRVTVENVKAELLIGKNATAAPTKPIHTAFHTHAYTELFVCTSGEITIATESGELSLSKNGMGIIPSDLPHILSNISYDGVGYAIGIMLTRRNDAAAVDLYSQLAALLLSDRSRQLMEMNSACECVERLSCMRDDRSHITALRLILSLVEAANSEDTENSGRESAVQDLEISRISRLETVVGSYFTEPLTTAQLAAMLNIGERQLSRIVKKRYGMTFHRVLTEKRLTAAVRLLEREDLSSEKIAEEVGFGSVASFYREFSKKYAMSPSDYKKRHING